MVTKKPSRAPRSIWTYAYQLVPPQNESRLHAIKHLLKHERADARRGARTWAGRVILEQQVTHILIVSDSPEQGREVNHRLETELREMEVEFQLTVPMAVAGDAAQ